MLQETTVREVQRRNLVRKRDNKPFTLYEIIDHTGTKWTTGRRDLAEEANNNIGKPVQIQGHSEVNAAGYTNYYLDDLHAGGNGTSQALPAPDSPFGPPPGAPGFQPRTEPLVAQEREIRHDSIVGSTIGVAPSVSDVQKQTFIMRQTAAKVASTISPSAAEFWANCDALVAYFMTGNKPNIIPSTQPPAPQSNKFFTEAILSDPGPEPEKPMFDGDDDIPF